MIHTIDSEMVEQDKQNRKDKWMKKHSPKKKSLSMAKHT